MSHRRRDARPGRLSVLLAVCVIPLGATVACGQHAERSLCRAFEDFQEAAAAIDAADPTELTTAEVSELAEDYVASVRQLRETSDGRYRSSIDTLEATSTDVQRTLESVDDDADYDTWEPLVEDSLQDTNDAASRVEELIEPQCTTVGDN